VRRRAGPWLLAAAGVGLAVALGLLAGGAPEEASSAARSGRGLLLARRYLERTGTPCLTLTGDRTPGRAGAGSVIEAFPAVRGRSPAWLRDLRRWVRRGGVLLLAYDATAPAGPAEAAVLDAFAVDTRPLPGISTLHPVRWWREARTPARLRGEGFGRPVLVSRPRRALVPAPDDATLLTAEDGGAVLAVARAVGRGLLVVVPSEALANQRLLEGGNAELLEALRARLAAPVAFDEAIHGLGPPPAGDRTGTPMADALLAQLALIYALAVAALAWRPGPPWPEPRPAGTSAAALLVRLGAVHRRLGHHRDAARAAVERAAELAGREPPVELLEAARRCRGDRELVEVARRVAAWQGEARRRRR